MRFHRCHIVTGLGTDSGAWLSPTRVWRLSECPASVGPVGTKPIASIAPSVNAGTLAHRAMQTWIQLGGFRVNDPRRALAHAIDSALALVTGVAPANWAVTRARLMARASALTDLLTAADTARVISETALLDPQLKIRGTPDVVTVGEQVSLIDLKTQTLKQDHLSPWTEFQLTIYAHLVERTYGKLPSSVVVFSLNRGVLPIIVTPASVHSALDAVAQARAADPSMTRPKPDVCRYCARRLDCQPHWDAARFWPSNDGVEGIVQHTEQSATGVVAALLETADGAAWVTGMPADALTLRVGAAFRAVRLVSAGAGSGDRRAWRWTGASAAV